MPSKLLARNLILLQKIKETCVAPKVGDRESGGIGEKGESEAMNGFKAVKIWQYLQLEDAQTGVKNR